MSHQRWHFLEKIQVQIAAALGLAVMYFLAWPTIRPWDPEGAVVFLPMLAIGRLIIFACVLWLLAALTAAFTTSARPVGALLAALVAAGGASLRSGSIRSMLMRYETSFPSLYLPLIVELIALAAVLAGAIFVIHLTRRLIRSIRPNWVRPESLLASPLSSSTKSSSATTSPAKTSAAPKTASQRSEQIISLIAAVGITLIIGYILLIVTLFSTDRGQILFALAISFCAGAAVAQYLFPNPSILPHCLAVLLMAVFVYLKACLVPPGQLNWTLVSPLAHALPIDWLCAGCGGAVGGHWLASRLHDLKLMPSPDTQDTD